MLFVLSFFMGVMFSLAGFWCMKGKDVNLELAFDRGIYRPSLRVGLGFG